MDLTVRTTEAHQRGGNPVTTTEGHQERIRASLPGRAGRLGDTDLPPERRSQTAAKMATDETAPTVT
eukprot:4171153-Amphidinium_carterae.1